MSPATLHDLQLHLMVRVGWGGVGWGAKKTKYKVMLRRGGNQVEDHVGRGQNQQNQVTEHHVHVEMQEKIKQRSIKIIKFM